MLKKPLSDEGFLSEVVHREPSSPERWPNTSRLILDQMKMIIGPHGKVWGQKVTGRFAEGGHPQYNVFYQIDGGHEIQETLLLYGHYDVVPRVEAYDQYKAVRQHNQLWRHPEEPRLVYGLGTEDMNGPNTGICKGVQKIISNIQSKGLWEHRRILGAFVFGEETWSPGFAAAREEGMFEEVDACITPEIMVDKSRLRMPRAVGYGRLGRYVLSVTCRGEAPHIGAVTEDTRRRATRALEDRAIDFIRYKLGILPHPDPQGIMPNPVGEPSDWDSAREGGITPPGSSRFNATIHFACPTQTLDDIVEDLRKGLASIAQDVFPNNNERDTAMRKHAYEIVKWQHPYEFTMPYKDDVHHPFHDHIRRFVHEAYRLHGDPTCMEPVDRVVQRYCDAGVADCGRLAHLGFPVAGVYPLGGPGGNPLHPLSGGGAHTAEERLWMPSIDEIAHVVAEAARHEGQLAPRPPDGNS